MGESYLVLVIAYSSNVRMAYNYVGHDTIPRYKNVVGYLNESSFNNVLSRLEGLCDSASLSVMISRALVSTVS
jgi:hypothetical protein